MSNMNLNLLKETKQVLKKNNLTLDDIVFCCGNDSWFSKELFINLAHKTDYYAGFGGAEIATDLKIVGNDWWLERHEYDGSEWWEFKRLPIKPDNQIFPNTLLGDGWQTILEANSK